MLAVKPASARQLGYIEKLKAENGETEPAMNEELTRSEASKIIQGLISKQNGNINEPRLGMAIKECFRVWNHYGRDVYDEKRERFIQEAIATYQLFTEIDERVRAST